MIARESLLKLLRERSVRRGSFTLASGRQSDVYIDARATTMSPEGLSLIGPLGLLKIRERGWAPDSVGGLTLGADPVSYAISYASSGSPPMLRAFTVRKQPKDHGTQKLIEGPFHEGDRVVVIEDVITSGASALRAAEAVRHAGGIILGVLAIVDREEGGRENLSRSGLDAIAIATAAELTAPVRS